MSARFDLILLAAQRAGVTNPLAEVHGVSHKCLIPIADQMLIALTLASVSSHPGCRAIYVLIEPDGERAVRPVAETFARADMPIEFIASDSNIAGSVLLGCEKGNAPFVITTADNVLIKHDSIDQVMATMDAGADAVAAMANKDDIRSVHPAAQRFFYEFRDNGYANCNLYGVADKQALRAVEIFREGGQFMKHPRRLVNAFGLFNILLMRFGWVTIDNAFECLTRN